MPTARANIWDSAASRCRGFDGMSDEMQFDDQARHYFGTDDLGTVPQDALIAGIERMRVDLGLATDAPHRFALWTMLYMLGAAPDLEETFKSAEDREAARDLMDMLDAEDED